jgi:hypothetical protein
VSTRPPCGPRSRRRRYRAAPPVTSRTSAQAALAAAVALTARLALDVDVPREAVLGDKDPGAVLVVLEVVTAHLLKMGWPEDGGAEVLSRVGLALADLEAG